MVTDVERSGRVKGRASIAYRFSALSYDGERHDVTTAPVAHQAEATKGEDAAKIAIGAGAGAGTVLATRGEEVRLGPGATVNTRLTAPLTVRLR